MIDPKDADHFKARNISPPCAHSHGKGSSCCVPSEVLIPVPEQTALEKVVAEEITSSALALNLNEIMEYCEERYQSISEKGQQESMTITNEVQKYLVDSILSEAVNHYIYKKVIKEIARKSQSINSSLGLWATPATWYSKYPNIKLELFEGPNLAQLLGELGWTVIQK